MDITVIGCGRWGSCIGWHLDRIGHNVTLYEPAHSAHLIEFIETRTNGMIVLPESIRLSSSLAELSKAEVIIISIDSQGLAGLMEELEPYDLWDKPFVLCMKGIEIETGRRLSQVASEATGKPENVAVWIGPGHVQEFYRGVPNCMVIDSVSDSLKRWLVEEFSSDLIRFYYGSDLIGNEIGAASKNVIGIAAGMLDGLDLASLKGALMSRGTREISRLIEAMGGNPLSAYGLCHLGDYEATVFSHHSNNRQFGESWVKGESFTALAEGYYTTKAMMLLSEKYGVELPICTTIYNILYNKQDVREQIDLLFSRSIKQEF